MVDPGDAEAIAGALPGELERLGVADSVRLARLPTAVPEATSTWVWFIELEGTEPGSAWHGPLVLRVYRAGELSTARKEHQLAGYLSHYRYPAPASLVLGDPDGQMELPFVIQKRVPGIPALQALGRRPWTVRGLVTDLARVQAGLHTLPAGGVPLPGGSLSERFIREDLDRRRRRITAVDPTDGLAWLQQGAPAMTDRTRVICHGDFHPLNVLVHEQSGPTAYFVVDWTDAALGDPHFDVARTMAIYWLAGKALGSTPARTALTAVRGSLRRWHRNAYEAATRTTLDDVLLSWWEAVHVYRGWLQLMEVAEQAVIGPASTTRDAMPSGLPAALLERFGRLRRDIDRRGAPGPALD